MQDDNPSLILSEDLKFLYLGSGDHVSDDGLLKTLGVTHILNITQEHQVPNHFPEQFVYKRISISDKKETNIMQHFDEAHDFISSVSSGQGVIFVHCSFGVSRSATIVVSYVMKRYNMGLEDALRVVKKKRPVIKPNLGFMKQLVQYERVLFGKRSFDWENFLDEMEFMDDSRKLYQLTSPEPYKDKDQ